MTSDLDVTTGDLHTTIREMWQRAQTGGGTDDEAPPDSFGQKVVTLHDEEIADATGLELPAVREYLENADGVEFVIGRDGDARSVKGLI